MLGTLSEIKEKIGSLKPAEKRVADYILKDPQLVVRATITGLSEKAKVSEPTVIRFCRKIGLSGYTELRLNLARDLPPEEYNHETVTPQDSPIQILDKYIRGNQEATSRAINAIDAGTIQEAVDVLTNADKIEIYGQGSPGFVALDAQFKFFRLGIHCNAHTNVTMQYMSTALLNPQSAAIIISNNGSVKDVIQIARSAKNSGAKVIGIIGRKRSPLARICDIVLSFQCDEVAVGVFPFATRFVHMEILDILYLTMVMNRDEKLKNKMENSMRTIVNRSIS